MKAAVMGRSPADPLVAVRDVPVPSPSPGWVLVRLHAAALNRFDTMLSQSSRRNAVGSILGAEGAGTVAEVGAGTHTADAVQVGSEVTIFPTWFSGSDLRFPDDAKTMWTPVIDSIYPLERVDAAYKRLQSPQRMGKVVLTIPPCITPDMEEDLR